jgi:hypothetical protein
VCRPSDQPDSYALFVEASADQAADRTRAEDRDLH